METILFLAYYTKSLMISSTARIKLSICSRANSFYRIGHKRQIRASDHFYHAYDNLKYVKKNLPSIGQSQPSTNESFAFLWSIVASTHRPLFVGEGTLHCDQTLDIRKTEIHTLNKYLRKTPKF